MANKRTILIKLETLLEEIQSVIDTLENIDEPKEEQEERLDRTKELFYALETARDEYYVSLSSFSDIA